jgi:L-alanine-DL-glutamate epimerase-like enolase superfamily enzyme
MADIEMALWDIVGETCGQPAYNLAEGKVRTRVVIFIVSSFSKKTDPSVSDA